MLKKLIQSIRSPLRRPRAVRTTPEVFSNQQHSLRRDQFSRNAVNVVERLQKAGYQAYIVGGGVRDPCSAFHQRTSTSPPALLQNRFAQNSATPA